MGTDVVTVPVVAACRAGLKKNAWNIANTHVQSSARFFAHFELVAVGLGAVRELCQP